ncbi:MAG: FliH/SctL family protein [Acidobacteriota bacterium]
MSKLIKSGITKVQAVAHTAPVLEREAARVHRVKREEDKADLEARIRSECEAMYTAKIAEAYAKGVADGRDEAAAQASGDYEAYKAHAAARCEEFMTAIGEQHAALRNTVEETVIALALEIGSRVVKREIELSSPIIAQIRDALRRILGVEKVRIKINRQDEELVRAQKTELHQAADSVKEFVLDIDEKITPGGCILESELGNVDARIETQLRQIEDALGEHTHS